MKPPVTVDIPIACELATETAVAQRHTEVEALFQQVQAVSELDDGYAFRFPGTMQMAADLLDFINAERECCSFFTIALIFTPNQGEIWLHLRGHEGVKAFVWQEIASRHCEKSLLPDDK